LDSRGILLAWGTWEGFPQRKAHRGIPWTEGRDYAIAGIRARPARANALRSGWWNRIPKRTPRNFLRTETSASSRPDCFCASLRATSAAWPATARLRTVSARGLRPSPQSAPLPLCPTFAPVLPPVRNAAKFQCLTPVPPRIGMCSIAKRSGPGPHAHSRQSSRPVEPEYPFTHATTHMYQSEIAVIQSGTASSVNCTKVFVKLQELRNQLLPRPVVLSTSSPIANSYTSYIESRFAPQNDLARTDD
jgi:hypothetical protein